LYWRLLAASFAVIPSPRYPFLPSNITLSIFSSLSFSEIKAALQVNKDWRGAVFKARELWERLGETFLPSSHQTFLEFFNNIYDNLLRKGKHIYHLFLALELSERSKNFPIV
jgi:hypothetical protein